MEMDGDRWREEGACVFVCFFSRRGLCLLDDARAGHLYFLAAGESKTEERVGLESGSGSESGGVLTHSLFFSLSDGAFFRGDPGAHYPASPRRPAHCLQLPSGRSGRRNGEPSPRQASHRSERSLRNCGGVLALSFPSLRQLAGLCAHAGPFFCQDRHARPILSIVAGWRAPGVAEPRTGMPRSGESRVSASRAPRLQPAPRPPSAPPLPCGRPAGR